jgi:hypothetical protein
MASLPPPLEKSWVQDNAGKSIPHAASAVRKHSARKQTRSRNPARSSDRQRIDKLESTVRDLQEQIAKMLAPQAVRTVEEEKPSSLTLNNAWLREHKHEYRGKWVALRAGVLLGAHESRVTLHRQLEQRGDLAGSAFARL